MHLCVCVSVYGLYGVYNYYVLARQVARFILLVSVRKAHVVSEFDSYPRSVRMICITLEKLQLKVGTIRLSWVCMYVCMGYKALILLRSCAPGLRIDNFQCLGFSFENSKL